MGVQIQIPGGPLLLTSTSGQIPGGPIFIRTSSDAVSGFSVAGRAGLARATNSVSVTKNAAVTGRAGIARVAMTVSRQLELAITLPANDVIYQRIVATANRVMTIAGTYTGSPVPTSLDARVYKAGEIGTEVVAWTALGSFSAAAGVWSGTLTVPQGTAGALLYNVQIRDNATSETASSTNEWGIGVRMLDLGQSNIRNQYDNSTTYTPNAAIKRQSGSTFSPSVTGTWAPLNDTSRGAAMRAERIIDKLGVPVGLLNYAIGGSSIDDWRDASGTDYYKDARKAIQDVGGDIEWVVWGQGEADIVVPMSQATYEGHLWVNADSLITNLRADITNVTEFANVPILICVTGRLHDATDADAEAIKAAQRNAAATVANVYVAAETSGYRLELDFTHYELDLAYGQPLQGKTIAQAVAHLLGVESYHQGPYISKAVKVNSTTVDVHITHRGGTDFTPTTGIECFEVVDAGTPQIPSAAVRINAGLIRLTTTTLVGPTTVRHLYGIDAGLATTVANPAVVHDDSEVELPLEPAELIGAGLQTAISGRAGLNRASSASTTQRQAVMAARAGLARGTSTAEAFQTAGSFAIGRAGRLRGTSTAATTKTAIVAGRGGLARSTNAPTTSREATVNARGGLARGTVDADIISVRIADIVGRGGLVRGVLGVLTSGVPTANLLGARTYDVEGDRTYVVEVEQPSYYPPPHT